MKPPLFVLFFVSPVIFPVEPGFDFREEIIFSEESPFTYPVYTNLETSVFFKYRYFGEKISLTVSPRILINKNRPYIGLYEFLLSVYGNYVVFNMGKNNIYFGEGISHSLFFPMLPVNNVSGKYLYNLNMDGKLSSVNILTGLFADTENMDIYKNPAWCDAWAVLQYSKESFTAGFESDALFSLEEKKIKHTKLALEGLFLFPGDFNLYGDISFLIRENDNLRENLASLMGFSKSFLLKNFSMTSIMEFSYKNDFGYALYQRFGFSNMINVIMGIEGSGNQSLNGILKIEYLLNKFKCEISGTGGNFLADNKKENTSIFMGVIYGYN
jgi:hypothetical protein